MLEFISSNRSCGFVSSRDMIANLDKSCTSSNLIKNFDVPANQTQNFLPTSTQST